MVKLVGALMVACACVLLGRLGAVRLKRHCELLAGLQQGLLLLEKEIGYAATPLPPALEQSAKAAGPAAAIFHDTAQALLAGQGLTAAEAWEAAIAPLKTQLTDEEYDDLRAFAAGLGLTDSANQLKRIELTRLKLAEAERQARDIYNTQGKVRKSLGWAAGAALVLLFI